MFSQLFSLYTIELIRDSLDQIIKMDSYKLGFAPCDVLWIGVSQITGLIRQHNEKRLYKRDCIRPCMLKKIITFINVSTSLVSHMTARNCSVQIVLRMASNYSQLRK